MLKPIYLRLFEKEVARAKKRGKDIEKLKGDEISNYRRAFTVKKSQPQA
jgi:hypothetical protein